MLPVAENLDEGENYCSFLTQEDLASYWRADDLCDLAQKKASSKRAFSELNLALRHQTNHGLFSHVYGQAIDEDWQKALSLLGFQYEVDEKANQTTIQWQPRAHLQQQHLLQQRSALKRTPPPMKITAGRQQNKRRKIQEEEEEESSLSNTTTESAAECEHEWRLESAGGERQFGREKCSLCEKLRKICHGCGAYRLVDERDHRACCDLRECRRLYYERRLSTKVDKPGLYPCDLKDCRCNSGLIEGEKPWWNCERYRNGSVRINRRKCSRKECGLLRNSSSGGHCSSCTKRMKKKSKKCRM